ncbi:MAG: peptide deformylase [Planctomycetota bacterium]|jgi:peptide deformylase
MCATPTYPEHLALVYYPAPVLRQPAQAVTVFDDALAAFCDRMLDCMDAAKGVGLAAPQVGVSKRIFVTNHRGNAEGDLPDRRVWINPTLELSGPLHRYEEGCLSIPGLYGQVERPSVVNISWQDVRGEQHQLHLDSEAGDFLAVVVQHEADHLDGTLFLDHLSPPALNLLRRKLRDLEKTYKRQTGKAGSVLRR